MDERSRTSSEELTESNAEEEGEEFMMELDRIEEVSGQGHGQVATMNDPQRSGQERDGVVDPVWMGRTVDRLVFYPAALERFFGRRTLGRCADSASVRQ